MEFSWVSVLFEIIFLCSPLEGHPFSEAKVYPRIRVQDGLLVQKHEINTLDFYLLSLYRVLGRHDREVRRPDKPPVLLMHGILGTSEGWTVLGEKSLPHLLENAGYDVWMGNSRGNVRSRKHMFYNSLNDSQYWEFSWHEMGIFDLPAKIDYILNVTGHEKLFYVGYSQGATQFYALAFYLPEYNDKIIAMHGLASGGFQSHAQSPLLANLAKNLEDIQAFAKRIHLNRIAATTKLLRQTGLGGFASEQLDELKIPMYLRLTNGGASLRQVIHFVQLFKTGKFAEFDFGDEWNQVYYYGQNEPPSYELENATAKIYLYYGLNDLVVSPIDVKELANRIPNCAGVIQVQHPKWTHVDFIFGEEADVYVYRPILELLRQDLIELTK